MGHHDEWQDERPVCMCPAHDDDTRIRDVTEATNVEEMMSPSAFSLIRPTIVTCMLRSKFLFGRVVRLSKSTIEDLPFYIGFIS